MGPNEKVTIIDKKGSAAQTRAQFLLFDRKRAAGLSLFGM